MTVRDTDTTICEVATLVRAIVEEISKSMYHPVGEFPGGWCDACSKVLGTLLTELGVDSLIRVVGIRGEHDLPFHVWLQRQGLVIDITADQFKENFSSPVVVTTDSPWHAGLKQSLEELETIQPGTTESELFSAVTSSSGWLDYKRSVLRRPA